MTSSNLAVCFLPSLFRITDIQLTSPSSQTARAGAGGSDARVRSNPGTANPGTANPGATIDGYQQRYKSALACLSTLITNADYLLTASLAFIMTRPTVGAH